MINGKADHALRERDKPAVIVIENPGGSNAQQRLRPGLCGVNPDKPFQYGAMAWPLPRGDVAFKAGVD